MTPVTISGVQPTQQKSGRIGPWQYGSNLYTLLWSNTATTGFYIYKSTDSGATWSRTTLIVASASNGLNFDCVPMTDGVAIAWFSSSNNISIVEYSFATDSVSATITTTGSPSPQVSVQINSFAIGRRSNGDYIAVFNGPTVTAMGTPYRRAQYAVYTASSGTWGTATSLDGFTTTTTHGDSRMVVFDSAGRAYLFYTTSVPSGTTAVTLKPFSTSNVLGSAVAVNSATSAPSNYAVGTPEDWVSAGSEYISVPTRSGPSGFSSFTRVVASATPSGASYGGFSPLADTENDASGPGAMVAVDANTIYAITVDATTDDIEVRTASSSSALSAPTTFYTGNVTFISAALLSSAIGVLFYDQTLTQMKYDAVALSAGSPQLAATSGNGTSTATASNLVLPSQALASSASVGTSTVAASRLILPSQALASSAAIGTSTTSASRLIEPFGLAGASTGDSSASATRLLVLHGLVGASTGTSTDSASTLVLPSQALTASVAGTSSASASSLVLPSQALTGASTGTSSAVADTLTVSASSPQLAGASTGTSTATASTLILPSQALAGASTGAATTAASRLIVPFGLTGASTGASTVAASGLRLPSQALTGASAGAATTAASRLIVPFGLTASVVGTSSAAASGLILPTQALASNAAIGTSSATATGLRLPSQALAGASAGDSSTAAARLVVPFGLAGASAGTSSAAASTLTVATPALTYRSSTHAQLTGTIAKPTGTIDNDVMIAAVVTNAVPSAPAGWTQQGQVLSGSIYLTVYSKIAASEGASYTFAGGTVIELGITTLTGEDTTTLLDGTATTASTAVASVAAPSITIGTSGSMLVGATFGYATGGDGTGLTEPGTTTERWEEALSNTYFLDQWTETRNSTGATGTRTTTLTGTLASGSAMLTVMLGIKSGGPAVTSLAGTSSGTSTTAATRLVLPSQSLAAASSGTSAAAALRIVIPWPLSGASAGTSTATSDTIKLVTALAGGSTGTSTISALRLLVLHRMVGSSSGTSLALASILGIRWPLAGLSFGTSLTQATTIAPVTPVTPWHGRIVIGQEHRIHGRLAPVALSVTALAEPETERVLGVVHPVNGITGEVRSPATRIKGRVHGK